MSLTPSEIQLKFATIFADNTTGQISEADLRELVKNLTDYLGVAGLSEIIPTWAAQLEFNTDGTVSGEFCRYQDTSGSIRLWQTKTDDNTGNAPPNDPGITENTHWLEVSPSDSSAFVEWSPGVYGSGLILVFYNNAFYKLEEAARPFESVNIETEIAASKWVLIGGLSEAPIDGNQYARKNAGWEQVAASGGGTGIFEPVQDITALKAIDTTTALDYPDKWAILVEDEGQFYRLDRESAVTEALPYIIAPTTGVGRWIQDQYAQLQSKQDKEDNSLTTTSKEIVGAINEVDANIASIQGDQVQLTIFKYSNTSGAL